MTARECFISVDVETAGPIPGEFSMLSIGACLVDAPERRFECLIKPITNRFDAKAMEVSGLSMHEINQIGLAPETAMTNFEQWITAVCDDDGDAIMVGLNAPFDWSFVNYYFHRFVGRNPFGFTAIDIKAFFMGAMNSNWKDTRSSRMRQLLDAKLDGDHNALHDALSQAEIFRLIRDFRSRMR